MKNVFYQTEKARGSASPQAAAPRRLRTKRLIALAAALLVGMQWGFAYDFYKVIADNTLYFKITNATDHHVMVTYPSDSENTPWNGFAMPDNTVELPQTVTHNSIVYTVTSIDNYAFRDCTFLTSVSIPNSVTSIGNYAFWNCYRLAMVEIPYSVTTIGQGAFQGCPQLTSIEIPNSVTTIGEAAFVGCTGLTSIVIPSSVTTIGDFTFYNCTGLTSIVLGSYITSIGNSAFRNCTGLESITVLATTPPDLGYYVFESVPTNISVYVPCGSRDAYMAADGWSTFTNMVENCNIEFEDPLVKDICVAKWDTNGDGELSMVEAAAVTDLEFNFYYNKDITSFDELQYFTGLTSIDYGFGYCTGLTSIVIPSTVTTIGSGAFRECTSLAEITFPNSVTTIEGTAFRGCTSLTSITIPSSVTTIEYNAFGACTGLVQIVVESGNTVYDSRNNCNAIIETATNTLVAGCKTTVIPGDVTTIGEAAFAGCTGLTSIEIPSSVTTIGDYAFQDCTGLTTIELPNSVTTIGKIAFAGCTGLTTIEIPSSVTTIKSTTFSVCTSLTSITIPNTVTSIEFAAFWSCTSLTSIVIPNSVTTIGNSAFERCTGLASIVIGNSVTYIDMNAFYGCTGLESINVLATTPPTLGTDAFKNVDKTIPVYVPCGSLAAYQSAEGWSTFTNMVENCNIVFEDPLVKNICVANWDTNGDGELSYAEAAAVSSITESSEFHEQSITSFPELQHFTSLTTIGNYAFDNCSQLASITLPESLTTIEAEAFNGCESLTYIWIPEGVTTIGFSAFGSTGLESINIPASVSQIEASPFYNCYNLKTIEVLPDNTIYTSNNGCNLIVERSTNKLIVGCANSDIYEGIEAIEEAAFYGNTSITTLELPSTLQTIGVQAFSGCINLAEITCRATTPPALGTNAFKNVPTNISVYVPCGSLAAYQSAEGWSTFTNMVENCNIVFEDPLVKNICVANWDTNGDGELSMAEAEAVTSLGYKFYGKGITSFNELQYFTGLTSIGYDAFSDCFDLTSIVIPSSVTSIEGSAFMNCHSLTSIVIPNSVTTIGIQAFYGCTALTSIQISNSVTTISMTAFYGCTALTSIEIPNSVTTISMYAFYGCTALTSIEIPNSVTSIGVEAFEGCTGLAEIVVESGNTVYDSRNNCNAIIETATNTLVAGCKTTVIPGDVTTIGVCAFKSCTSLTSIEIPNSVTTIGVRAFMGCEGLTSIEIPSSVTYIDMDAFYGCTGLESITVLATTPPQLYDNFTFNEVPTNIPVNVPCGSRDAYMAAYAWSNFTNIKEKCNIEFEDQLVENICVDTETGWDTNGDRKLSYYEAAQVTDLGTWFQDNGIVRFNELQYFTGLSEIGEDAFMECEQLASIILPEGVTSIGKQAFAGCKELKSIIIPENVTTISLFAFYLSGLESIVIPANVTQLAGAFLQCPLQSISVHPDNLTYTSNNGCNVIVEKATNKLIVGCANSDIYEGIEAIEDGAFFYNTEITTLELPSTLQTIGVQAFQGCSNLQSIVLPASLTSIGEDAFRGCRNLQTMELPANLTSIGNNAFYACRNLAEITCRAEVPPTLGTDAFKQVTTTIPVYVPCGSLAAYQSATGWSNFTNMQEDCETITLSITGYGNNPTTTEGWHLIASPLEGVSPENVGNMLSNNYDLYQFHGGFEGAEWRNYKNNENNGFTMLYAGNGYLYANSEDVTLEFKGSVLNLQEYPVYLIKDDDTRFGNWNLVGNSFTTEATVSKTDYYRIEPGTRTLMPSSGNVNPMEGIFVEANEYSEMVTFTKLTRGERAIESPMVNIDLRNAEGRLLDRARLRMGEGNNLGKLDMLSDPNRLYFRIDGKDYAVARVNGQGEMPLHFDAAQNGTYSLNVNVEGMEMAYLHLIDNMTGEDIDLLAPNGGDARHCVSTYTFTGKPSDYASRFRLVFETGSSAEGDSFAFIDAAGNIVITNTEAGATLQVIDVTGRVMVCRDASNASAISTSGMTAGVYVLRLINGDDVKVQKIVVD